MNFSIKHYGNEYKIAGDMGDDVVKDLNDEIKQMVTIISLRLRI